MTTRDTTQLLARPDLYDTLPRPLRERLDVIAFGAIQWPWLLCSLWGGRKADKAALLARLDLPADALPNLGSWKADTRFCSISSMRSKGCAPPRWSNSAAARAASSSPRPCRNMAADG